MPELPEVESVVRTLKKDIIGKKINNVVIRYEDMFNCPVSYFKDNVIGHTFTNITRKGKFIIFHLENDTFIISHLRMEGKYFYLPKNSIDNKHIHVIFELGDYNLYYQDVRKFGIMDFKTKDELFSTKPLSDVANDPLEGVNREEVLSKLKKKKNTIKEALLDQSIISGLGNIYVDEVLFKSHILPTRLSNTISEKELRDILDYSKEIFLESIKLGGTTIKSFTVSLNHSGAYQNNLLVHTKSVCPVCNNNLTIIKIGGRSTYYCASCQK